MMTFRSTVEVEKGLQKVAKIALDKTVEEFYNKLGDFIQQDIYDVYTPKWYQRTNTLSNHYRDMFERYDWNYFGKGVGAGLRINDSYELNTNPTAFVHGSGNPRSGAIYTALETPSYLEILNDPSIIDNNNPFHFPNNNPNLIISRGSFWDDFVEWCEDNFYTIFQNNFNNSVNAVHISSSDTTI